MVATPKFALFDVGSTDLPLLRPDGSVTFCPKKKAILSADVFDSKQTSFPDAS